MKILCGSRINEVGGEMRRVHGRGGKGRSGVVPLKPGGPPPRYSEKAKKISFKKHSKILVQYGDNLCHLNCFFLLRPPNISPA